MERSQAAYRGSHDGLIAGLALALSLACSPEATRRPPPPERAPEPFLSDPRAFGPSGVRRLSRAELVQTFREVLGVSVEDAVEQLPPETSGTSFDNDHTQQVASPALVEGLRHVADTAAERFVAAAPALGCAPSASCLADVINRIGHRLLRRPLNADELAELVPPDAEFWPAVGTALRVLLQDPEVIYRLEIGTGGGDVVRLAEHELAARLSYTLTGGPPEPSLLRPGALATPQALRAAAEALLSSPAAQAHWQRFFARWLSYEDLSSPSSVSLRREADALVDRFALNASWPDLFRADETFADEGLAALYGLPATGWVSWGHTGRRGLLSTGAILSNGAGPGTTSVVQRGAYVSRRLLCKPVPAPPPEMSGLALPREETRCKRDLLRAHATLPACAGCHRDLDGTGQGLEGYDGQGAARTEDESGCRVDPVGEVALADGARATFSGPAELARVLLDTGTLQSCFVTQLYAFVLGRPVQETDAPALEAIAARLAGHGHRLRPLLVDLVTSAAFQHRQVREAP